MDRNKLVFVVAILTGILGDMKNTSAAISFYDENADSENDKSHSGAENEKSHSGAVNEKSHSGAENGSRIIIRDDKSEAKHLTGAKLCFPKHFLFGVATAAYQIEGAWNVSGKGESMWDRFTHTQPDRILNHDTGDVADDSYHLYKEDVRMLKDLGVQFYRFSMSWTRILPTGFSNKINEDGVRYYTELIEELHNAGIKPLVTMYHWDLPQSLQDLGGWTNPIMADYFVDYARVLLSTFPTVKAWATFNEPLSFCRDGYGGDAAPGARSSGQQTYMCGHNVLRAHGMTYRMFENEFREKNGASLGIVLDITWTEPATTSPVDKEAAETAIQFTFGWLAHPIFSKTGDYPPVMRLRIDEISRRQGFSRSRLPVFTEDEIDMIRGSTDFLGLNHYTTFMISKKADVIKPEPSFEDDMGVTFTQKQDWPKSNSSWLKVVPWGFRKALNWVKLTYNNPLTVVTENGYSTKRGLSDSNRIAYIDGYLRALYAAVVNDGCNVVGYTYWSLMDNFEWNSGYSERFGLYEVDYTSPNRTRTPRQSATFYSKIVHSKCIPAVKNRMLLK